MGGEGRVVSEPVWVCDLVAMARRLPECDGELLVPAAKEKPALQRPPKPTWRTLSGAAPSILHDPGPQEKNSGVRDANPFQLSPSLFQHSSASAAASSYHPQRHVPPLPVVPWSETSPSSRGASASNSRSSSSCGS